MTRRRSSLELALAAAALALAGCQYVRMLRPSVLKQLNPRVVDLVNELPNVDAPNKAVLGRLFAHGGLVRAAPGEDGVLHARIRIPKDQFLFEPAVIVLPRAGEFELEIANEDEAVHLILVSSNGVRQTLLLTQKKAGRLRALLDGPGVYTFACPVGNHAGRGELGIILVEGDTPEAARLDRPPQLKPPHG